MDASHVSWFNALFEDFKQAISKREYVGREAEEAYRCIEMITCAYESSQNGCRELSLNGLQRSEIQETI